MTAARRHRPPIAALAAPALVGLALAGLLVGFEPTGGDPDRIFRPIKAELARALAEGRLPFWSDRLGLGVPLVAESHVAAFYPPNVLLYRLLDVATAYRLAMWLHNVALAAATYAYARRVGVGPWGGAVAAVSFAFCGFQTVQSSHEWAYHALPYLPLCLLAADRFAETGRPAMLAGLGLAWGCQVLVGHFQVAMWTGVLSLAVGAWRVVADRRPAWRVIGLAMGLAWGGAVAAAQLVPTWELARIVGQTRRTYAELAFYSYPPAHWAEMAIPGLFRHARGGPESAYWFGQQATGYEACLFVGTIPLILACIGLVGGGRKLDPWRLIVPASFALATMPRWWPSGYAAVLQLPGLGYFRCPGRYTAITAFGLALLAGRGLDRGISAGRSRLGLGLAGLVGLAAAGWAVVWVAATGPRPILAEAGLATWIGLAAATWIVGLAAIALGRSGRVGGWAPLVLAAAEMAAWYYAGTTRWGWSAPLPSSSPVLAALALDPGAGRVGGAIDDLPIRAGRATATPYVGFPLPAPHPLLKAATDPRNAGDPAAARWLRRFGVTHAVWDGPVGDRSGEARRIGADATLDRLAYRPPDAPPRGDWRLVRLAGPFPEARAATRSVVAPDRNALVAALSRSDALAEAWFLLGEAPPDGPGPRARSARVVRWNGLAGAVEHDGTCDLVLARAHYPGWVYRVDDEPWRPASAADGGLLSARVEGAGVHRVAFRFRPNGQVAASFVSAAAAMSALLVLAWGASGRARRSGWRARVMADGPWDGYLVGPENALAQAGALALARGETEGVSPLVVHGAAGSGKTRLLAGLVAERLIRRPESAVAHLEAEAFAAACAEASGRPDGWSEVRERFRGLDLFVLDDVHALERAPWAMAELAHTLDALDAGGAAVAIAAREAPARWPGGWPARLVNRLVGGLAVRLEPPRLETRRRYLLERARALGLALPSEAVEPMAEAADGFRTLDGWLARVGLASRVDRRPPGLDLVAPILESDPVGEPPTLDAIARAVAGAFGVRARDLRAQTRRAAVVEARHLAMHLARSHTPLSFRAIGAFFGGRDAATVRHACRAAADRLAADPALAAASAALARSWAQGDGGGSGEGATR